jgi:hypothetical protein
VPGQAAASHQAQAFSLAGCGLAAACRFSVTRVSSNRPEVLAVATKLTPGKTLPDVPATPGCRPDTAGAKAATPALALKTRLFTACGKTAQRHTPFDQAHLSKNGNYHVAANFA